MLYVGWSLIWPFFLSDFPGASIQLDGTNFCGERSFNAIYQPHMPQTSRLFMIIFFWLFFLMFTWALWEWKTIKRAMSIKVIMFYWKPLFLKPPRSTAAILFNSWTLCAPAFIYYFTFMIFFHQGFYIAQGNGVRFMIFMLCLNYSFSLCFSSLLDFPSELCIWC